MQNWTGGRLASLSRMTIRHQSQFACRMTDSAFRFRILNQKMQLRVRSHMSTVAENRGNHTTAEFERAKAARKLHHASGTPSAANHKMILRSNQIEDCPVAEKDPQTLQRQHSDRMLQHLRENRHGRHRGRLSKTQLRHHQSHCTNTAALTCALTQCV